MLEKIGDWYRIAAMKPDHETLEKRQQSIKKIITFLKKDMSSILSIESGLIWRFDPNSEPYQKIVQISHEHDLRFPTDLDANENEVKVISALALGEVLTNSKPNDLVARLTASVFISALGVPRKEHEQFRHFSDVLKELQDKSLGLLAREGTELRRRPILNSSEMINVNDQFKKIEESHTATPPQDHNQLWASVAPSIKQTMNSIQKQVAIQKNIIKLESEEINVLWWSYSGRSSVTNEHFSEMEIGAIALCSGSEISDLLIAPPLVSTPYLLEDLITQVGTAKSIPESISLKDVVAHWNQQIIEGTKSTRPNDDIVKNFPALFPTTWISLRLLESEMSPNWIEEFEKKTGIDVGMKLKPNKWAEQVMWERLAQKVYEN